MAGRALGTGLTRLMRSLGSHGGWLRLLVVSAMVLLLPLGDGGGKGCVACGAPREPGGAEETKAA